MRCQCNCVHLTTDNTTGISRYCVNGSMRSSSICLMVVCFCSRCRRWLVLFYISSNDSMPDTLLEYCNAHLLPFPTQIDTILLTSITIHNSSHSPKLYKP